MLAIDLFIQKDHISICVYHPVRYFVDIVSAGTAPKTLDPLSKSFEGLKKSALGTKSSFKGRRAVFFSSEEVVQLAHSLCFALVGKFTQGAPTMFRLRKGLARVGLLGPCTVGALDSKNVLLKLSNEDDFSMAKTNLELRRVPYENP
ncbi:hypothetical protein BUALT_Bualt06G0000200 [Buddleja alternifolia]|uniref:Uncharacterized protein n=1 Tax=Buddleja alternifolia TaxID=168488 RepID=A0AAV6XCV5_9LAMI|nr:hypothetical protein BUALT_Bualt06G0000200 [Buddleja alternifolia]